MRKNILLGLLAMLLPLTGVAATASLSVEDFSIKAGEEKEMVISLSNPNDIITLVQFDLSLPAGLSIKKVDGEYDIDIAGRTTWKKHSLDANAQSDGTIRFLLASSSNTALSGTDGAIIKITLVADGTFTKGDIKVDNILLVTPEEKEITQNAISNSIDNSTPVTPPTPGTAKLSIEPFGIAAGGEAEMVIDLTNPDDVITLVQFDLSLPNGLSIKKVEGEYDIDIAGRTTWKKHSLDANAQADGSIRFLMASSSNTALSGSEGAIVKMTLVADNSFAEGDIKLDNILLVTPEEKESQPEAYTYHVVATVKDDVTLTAKSYTRIYGDANPTFEYTVSEGTITSGDPTITCSATETSPVGTYEIVISKGTVSNGTVNCVNGTLTITKAPLTVKAGNYTRQEGEENPTFTLVYEGFKNGETEAVLTQKPTAATTAMVTSTPGDYPITVSGGIADNYSFNYIEGVLTIYSKPVLPGTSKLFIEPFSIKAGGEAEMVIDLTNPDDEITLVQFDLGLPEGLSVKKVDGEYDIDIAGRTTWKKHSLDANEQADGTIRFLLASSSNKELTGTEGAIIKMTLAADSEFSEGDILLKNILLVTPEEKEITQEDVVVVEVKDIFIQRQQTPLFYTISGQRLKKPRKGINIIDGRKVIVK